MESVITAFKRSLDFQGRSGRKEYWLFYLFTLVIYVVLAVLAAATEAMLVGVLLGFYGVAIIVPSLAVSIRRMHDCNRSGWWVLINLVPLVGVFIYLYFAVSKGTEGENRFGADPLQPGQSQDIVMA
ncbi:DUF805 domain-containing protein [Candidatus Thalassolituus haligoni]|uniref:DUF805 domain-containing protein n=1 Tax=Candidatus Thalassolituus haligoni TaxID=3100113 RepID=UPI003518B8AA|tara:strand:- start:1713 stop:2093 length:381 start_codon:yes stop_codon:yes gene_type:complete